MPRLFLIFFLVIFFHGSAMAQENGGESNLKAVFIYNFTKYIEWDSTMLEKEFVIGVVGPSAIVNSLNEVAKNSFVQNRRIIIRSFSKPDDISFCNILFITQKIPFPLESVLSKVSRGMLTVSEHPGFAKLGTAFNFVLFNDKLKFEANLKAINSAGVKASSQLLKLAIIIE